VEYASEEYAKVLRQPGITPSMSRSANPYDNAFCASFMPPRLNASPASPAFQQSIAMN
jgi:transposase InsO family protein